MKIIFFGNSKEQMERVYAGRIREELLAVTGMDSEVYTKEDLLKTPDKFAEVEVIFSTWHVPEMTEEEIRRCLPSLKCLFYGAGSVQYFAKPFLRCGVRVFSAWQANAVPVAEYVSAQIILANKGFFSLSQMVKKEGYRPAKNKEDDIHGNYNTRVGILGAGMIGKMVIERLKSLCLDILVYDPFLPDEKAIELGVTKASLEEIFSTCKVISNHIADNPQTRGMLDYSLFSLVGDNVVFLNTGRGPQVVEEDLIRVLKEKEDFVAVLDVSHPEPPRPDSEFYTIDRCILTPHIAGSTGGEVCRLGEYMLEEYKRFQAGEPTLYEITEPMLETMA